MKSKEEKRDLWKRRAPWIIKGVKSISEMEMLLCITIFFVTGLLFFCFQTQGLEDKAALYAMMESKEYLAIITLFVIVFAVTVTQFPYVIPRGRWGLALKCLTAALNVGIEAMVVLVPGGWDILVHLLFLCTAIYLVCRTLEEVLRPPEVGGCGIAASDRENRKVRDEKKS